MARTYLYGYPADGQPQQRLTLTELEAKTTWRRLDDEFARRLLAMFDAAHAAGRDLGLGGGWRSGAIQLATALQRHILVEEGGCCVYKGKRYQLRPKTAHAVFPGLSYHEETTASRDALAADLIGDLDWANANCWRFGLLHFARVNAEPWHHQPVEIPRSRSKYKGEQLAVWPLPDAPTPGPAPILPAPTPMEDDMPRPLIIVGNEDNKHDPRRWAWDPGRSLQLLQENDTNLIAIVTTDATGKTDAFDARWSLVDPLWRPLSWIRSFDLPVA